METIRVIEEKFKLASPSAQVEDMLAQLRSARRLIELAVQGNPDGNDMLVCANAVMLHLRERLARVRSECIEQTLGRCP